MQVGYPKCGGVDSLGHLFRRRQLPLMPDSEDKLFRFLNFLPKKWQNCILIYTIHTAGGMLRNYHQPILPAPPH